ncbi:MAG: alpha/beta hydrolase, partial [Acidimicrobiia bacterium]|nr:alpha/beta hydrolase [Acidimicrobiia bacterium]
MRRQTVVIALVVVLVASACDGVISYRLDNLRLAAGVPAADTRDNLYLDTTAEARATARCGGPLETAPEIAYGGETAVAVAELTGAAPLDPAVADPDEREYRATELLWSQWMADPALVDPDLTVGGVATVDCGNDTLAGALVLREEPTMPADGRFVSDQYTNAELEQHLDLVYATVLDHTGQIIDLTLDIHAPPADGPGTRPAVVLFHGGGFTSGNKTNRTNDAKAYARRGFVGITASYRLRSRPVDLVPAALDAIDDGQEAIRWLRANAATYGIDPDRVAAAGTSSGGAVALGIASIDDLTPGGPLAQHDPTVTAAVSTGGHLTQGLDDLTFDGDEAPALAFHYELDRQGWEYAYQTCTALHAVRSVCDFVLQPGDGHTTNISPSGPWWTSEIGPFLWHHLELGAIGGPTPSEPFHMPTMLDDTTLDVTVIEDWHVDGAGTTRQKLIDVHVETWYDDIEIRVPVRLVLPLSGTVNGFTINGGSDPRAGDHAPTGAEQLALDGGVGVIRTFIKPIAQYDGLPSEAQLQTRLLAEADVRYSEPWLWAAIMMRSITAAFADDQIDPGPVLAWGGSKNGATPLVASIHDQRITGVQPSVAPAIFSPVRGHEPTAVAEVAAADADFDAARAAGLAPGDQGWGYYNKAFRSDALLATQAAGWTAHDVRAFMHGIADDFFISENLEQLAQRGVDIFSEPGSHDWVAYDVAALGTELSDLRQYIRPNAG